VRGIFDERRNAEMFDSRAATMSMDDLERKMKAQVAEIIRTKEAEEEKTHIQVEVGSKIGLGICSLAQPALMLVHTCAHSNV
jgi:hypothetical protein